MGLEIPIAWLSVLLFGGLITLLLLGLPMAFCTGSLAVIFLYVFGTGGILNMLPSRIFPFMTDYQLSAVPLFIFMAAMLEKAGIIEELFDVIYKWLGSVKGGLASATVIACTVLAAMVGVVGATEKPASIPYRANMTLLDAMIAVGGLSEYAAGNRARLVRNFFHHHETHLQDAGFQKSPEGHDRLRVRVLLAAEGRGQSAPALHGHLGRHLRRRLAHFLERQRKDMEGPAGPQPRHQDRGRDAAPLRGRRPMTGRACMC